MAQKKAERFWKYALTLYDQEAVREALLRLQDRDGADVPLLLWCVWCGAEAQGVSDEAMSQAVEFSAVWREQTVSPLRSLRRALKPGISGVSKELSEAARTKIATTEQAVERLQMDHLVELSENTLNVTARENIDRYARVAGLSLGASDVSILVEMR